MRAYSSLRELEEKGICVDEYLTNERDGIFKARLDYKRWGKKRNVLAYFKTAVRLWLPLGKTPVISAYPKLKKERY